MRRLPERAVLPALDRVYRAGASSLEQGPRLFLCPGVVPIRLLENQARRAILCVACRPQHLLFLGYLTQTRPAGIVWTGAMRQECLASLVYLGNALVGAEAYAALDECCVD